MTCARCGITLTPSEGIVHRRRDDYPLYKNALIIEILGGWDMYLDEDDTSMVICGSCAAVFLGENPWISNFIKLFAGNKNYR